MKNPFIDANGPTQALPDDAQARCDSVGAPGHLLGRRGALALAFALPACGAIERGTAVPASLQDSATIPGIPNARFWGDTQVDALRAEVFAALEREARHLGLASGRDLRRLPPAHLLALSGGSDYGAFGAGVLVGWTETGTRPEFKLVTGVSTGALSAPLAFIGPSKDPVLREVYTGIGPDQIFGGAIGSAFPSPTPSRIRGRCSRRSPATWMQLPSRRSPTNTARVGRCSSVRLISIR